MPTHPTLNKALTRTSRQGSGYVHTQGCPRLPRKRPRGLPSGREHSQALRVADPQPPVPGSAPGGDHEGSPAQLSVPDGGEKSDRSLSTGWTALPPLPPTLLPHLLAKPAQVQGKCVPSAPPAVQAPHCQSLPTPLPAPTHRRLPTTRFSSGERNQSLPPSKTI